MGVGYSGEACARCPSTPLPKLYVVSVEKRGSDIDHDVALRARAADQDISLRRRIERIGLVGDGPGDQSALAVVTDAGAARPPDGHVARFRELEKALVLRTPASRDPTARERHQRPCARDAR